MRYLGGKSRIAGRFAPVLNEALLRRDGTLVEPFVGGFNIVPALDDSLTSALCYDLHPGPITLYQALQSGVFVPPNSLSEDEYRLLRDAADWENPLTSFAAFCCSFGGKEWGGYARGDGRNFAAEQARALMKKKEHMGIVTFSRADYRSLEPSDCVVYADPPYANTTRYKTGDFDHAEFYQWCEDTAGRGCEVFVSEFIAPEHWLVVWEHERKQTIAHTDTAKRVERLYKVTNNK